MTTPKNMTNNQLFRALVNSQSAIKSELLGEINKLRQDTNDGFKKVHKRIDDLDSKLTYRIEALGKQLNTLDDDAPSGEEFKILEKRVTKIEKYTNFVTV